MSKQLTISLVTVGEPETFACIDRVMKLTPDSFDLAVWYDTKGEGLDYVFLQKLQTKTKNITILMQNKGPIVGHAFNMLYTDTPYVLTLSPDIMVMEDYYSKLMIPFQNNPKIGMVGEPAFDVYNEAAHKMHYFLAEVVNGTVHAPDMVLMIKREAINAVGGICPSIKFYGYDFVEYCGRLKAHGWESALILGLIDRSYLSKSAQLSNPLLAKWATRNELLMRQLRKKEFKGYDWWRNDMMKHEEVYWNCFDADTNLKEKEYVNS